MQPWRGWTKRVDHPSGRVELLLDDTEPLVCWQAGDTVTLADGQSGAGTLERAVRIADLPACGQQVELDPAPGAAFGLFSAAG